MSTETILLTDQLEKATLDDRQYRVIQLTKNSVEVLLIHDPRTEKASASMGVKAGSFFDDNLQGTAHAVEHLVFLGSEKFPEENEYIKFLADHAGSPSASTGYTDTIFSFDVAATRGPSDAGNQAATKDRHPHPLYGALERFAQFFIKPLFRPESLLRELKVIDAEFDKNFQDDGKRLAQLRRSLSNPEHPFSGFATGNSKTFHDDPRELCDKLRKYHKSHYGGFKLVILGKEPLDQLENWAIELFSEVPNRNLVQDRWDSKSLFTTGTQVFAKPIMDFHIVSIEFPFFDEECLYDTLPSRYIIHLLGSKGPGSILSYLKAKGWATEIVANAKTVCPGSAYFLIRIVLTRDGLTNYQKVVKEIFHYIGVIKERAPEEWVFNELKNLAELRFQLKPKLPAREFTKQLSNTMLKSVPRERLLSYGVPKRFDAELIITALSYFRDDNFKLMIVSQHSTCTWDVKEKWYETEYKEEKIPKGFLKEIADALVSSCHDKTQMLCMPLKNEFIPHDLSVEKTEVTEAACAPELIRCDKNARVWYKKDDRFWTPTASVKMILRTSGGFAPGNYIKARLYRDLLIDELEESLSGAEQAGMCCEVDIKRIGLEFSFYGNNEKMPMLIKKVVSMMRSLTVDSERFITIKEDLMRAYRNANMDLPFRQATHLLRRLTEEDIWTNDQYTAEIEYIQANDIEGFRLELQHNHIELLAHGNLRREEVLEMTNIFEKALQSRHLPQCQWHIRRDTVLEPGSNYTYEHRLIDPSGVDNCIQYYLHIGSVKDDILRARLILLKQICGEPALDRLRTKEQLGYIVESGVRYSATTMGYLLLIQSKYAARHLESRIETFLESFAQTLEAMTDEEFDIQKYSAINRLLAKFENMPRETESFWNHIQFEDLQFLRHKTEATLIKHLSKTAFIDFYSQYINPNSKTRAKLSILLTAHSAVNESAEALEFQPSSNREPDYIRDVGRFKAARHLSPGPVPRS